MQLADANERRAFCGAFYYIMRGADPAARNFNAMFSHTRRHPNRAVPLSMRVRVAREEVTIGLRSMFFLSIFSPPRYIASSRAIRDRRNEIFRPGYVFLR